MCTREDAANGRGFPSSTNYSYFDFDASVWISVKFRMFRKTPHVNSALISINTFRMGSSHFCISLYSGDDKFIFVALRFV